MKKILPILILPFSLLAQTHIYRSVQPDVSSAIGTGSGTLTISGTTATFSEAQPDSIGMGDAIQYDSDANGLVDAICFIHERTSSTVYTVANAAGGTPTAVSGDSDWDIFRAYTRIQRFEEGSENTGIDSGLRNFDSGNRNAVANTEIWHVACYPGVDSAWYHTGWNTNPTYYLEVFTPYLSTHAGRDMRHSGVIPDSSAYMISGGFARNIITDGVVTSQGLKLDGLQVYNYSGSGAYTITIQTAGTGAQFWISNCLIYKAGGVGTTNAIFLNQDADRVSYIWNNIIRRGQNGGGINADANAGTVYVYNNTVIISGVLSKGIDRNSATGCTVHAKNNIVQLLSGTSAACYEGTFASGDYNLSSDGTEPGTNGVQATLTFNNAAGEDYHLAAADASVAVGTDLSEDANLAFTTDIDNETRSTWNMGADEFSSVAEVTPRRKRKPIWWSIHNEKDILDFILAVR